MRRFKRDPSQEEKWHNDLMNRKCKICSFSMMQLHPEYPKVNAWKCSICGYTLVIDIPHPSVVIKKPE